MRAVPLAYLDRLDEASPLVEQILALKPAFHDHGRWLIERYVKFEELIDSNTPRLLHGAPSTESNGSDQEVTGVCATS